MDHQLITSFGAFFGIAIGYIICLLINRHLKLKKRETYWHSITYSSALAKPISFK